MNTRIKFKRGNSTQKLISEEVMNAGEPLLELNTNILYTATEDNTPVKNVEPINVSENASLGNHGKVSEIFVQNSSTVKEANHAAKADTATTISTEDSSDKIATTKFVNDFMKKQFA